MKFVCEQRTLNEAIASVIRFVSARPTHPVLGNIKLSASGAELTFTGFDLATGLELSCPAMIDTDGEITVPAKLLNDIVSRLPAGDLAIAVEDEMVTITSESGTYNMRGIAASEYPDFPEVTSDPIELPIGYLKAGIGEVLYAASTDETKQILTGVHIRETDQGLDFAATDGHRLACTSVSLEGRISSSETPLAVTIPSRALAEIDRLIAKRDDADVIYLTLDSSQAKLAIGDFTLFCRILEGAYPRYEQLIPAQFERKVTLDRKKLINALGRVGCLADQKNNLITFDVNKDSDTVTIKTTAQDIGQGSETLPVDAIGDSISIGFNLKYFSAAIKAISTDEVTLNLNEANQPVTITPIGDRASIHLIMPVQINR